MQAKFECIPCFARQAVEAARIATADPLLQEQAIREALRRLSLAELGVTPMELSQAVYCAVREVTGIDDPYQKIKQQSNAYALAKYPAMKRIVAGADDPLNVATRIAIAGNIIDFGVPSRLDIEGALDRIMQTGFALDDFDLFAQTLEQASRVLYLGDNAGEIVFDRVLIEQFSASEVTLTVKDEPFINDAMVADAETADFDEAIRLLPVPIYPGTNAELEAAWASADLIISKGQANYEVYSEAEGPLFYLLVAKCDVVARELGVNIGDMVLMAGDELSPR